MYGAAFAFGATVGSFLNVVIHRVPRGESIVHPRSRCPSCGTMIAAWHNVPILSWLFLRGRCASCDVPISARYPMVELLTGMLWLAVAVRYGVTWAALAGVLLASGLVVVTFVDLDHWEIPDEVSLPGIVVGALLRPIAFGAPWWDGVLAAAISAGILLAIRGAYMAVRGIEGMGLGDVKLIAMLTAFLGLGAILPIILVASLVGSVIGGALLLLRPSDADVGATARAADTSGGDAHAGTSEPTAQTEPVGNQDDGAALAAQTSRSAELAPSGSDDDDWIPPKNAVPFGPFLSLAGLTELLLGPLLDVLRRWPLG